MKKTIIILMSALALYGCRKKSEEATYAAADSTASYKAESAEPSPSASSDLSYNAMASGAKQKQSLAGNSDPVEKYISSSAAQVNPLDTSRKLIIKADLKFKVKSVTHTTYCIEDLVKKEGGFVTNSELNSNESYTETTAISADSTLESKHYTITNFMTVRVPSTKLDTTLKQIAKLIDYLDYRNIRVEDVALQLKANKWRKNRYQGSARRLTKIVDANAQNNVKVDATVAAEDRLLSSQEQEEQAVISNLDLEDQIRYSTITLTIYQRPSVYRELIANKENIKEYQPSFGSRFVDSIVVGWHFLEETILVLTKLWWLLGIVALVFFGVKRYRRSSKK